MNLDYKLREILSPLLLEWARAVAEDDNPEKALESVNKAIAQIKQAVKEYLEAGGEL